MNEGAKPVDGAERAASAEEVNPYVGLRPFEEEHSEFFFGRREQTLALLELLHSTRFVAVVGSSGSGKSSLVRAGLVPAIKGGFLLERRDQWRVSTMKPGSAPLRNLAAALSPEQTAPEEVDELQAKLLEEPTGAVLAKLGLGSEGHQNLLLVVDQFEELFGFLRTEEGGVDGSGPDCERLRTRRSAEAADFVSLLLELTSAKGLPVYVVLTMRSDFLGDCDLFHGLPEAINRSSFLVPRLTRAQLKQAIAGPARGVGVAFSPRLLDEILNEVGDRADRLPVTQHALLRTWLVRAQARAIDEDDYQKTGKLYRALEQHAEEAYEKCDKALAARVFKGLTDTDARGRRVRRASTLGELASLGEASIAGVQEVLRRFQEGGRYFLTVEMTGPEVSRRVDLSHESLIRQWPRLREWVDEERRDREQYQDLVRRQRRHAQGGDLLTGTDLELARKWWKALEPSDAWARRDRASGGEPELVRAYLAMSEATERRARWVRRFLAIVAGVTLVAFTAASWWLTARARAAEDTAAAAAARARSATLVAVAQTGTDPTRQAVVLREAENKAAASSLWVQGVMEALARPIAEVVLRHGAEISSVAFSPDGKMVVTGSGEETARVWLIDDDLLVAALWSATSDCLPVDQRQAFLFETTDEAHARHQRCRVEVARKRAWPQPREE